MVGNASSSPLTFNLGTSVILPGFVWPLIPFLAPYSGTLAWKISWMEEPGRLQSMGSLRVGHDWATSLSLFTFMHWRRKWQPNPMFLPGESREREAWWAAAYEVAQSRTRLKRLSSSSSSGVLQMMLNHFRMSVSPCQDSLIFTKYQTCDHGLIFTFLSFFFKNLFLISLHSFG